MIILEILPYLFGIIVSFFLWIRTKNFKYLKEFFDMIKYKTSPDTSSVSGQDFTNANMKPVYRLNRATGELEKTDEVIDVQELIQSCVSQALDAALERFFPTQAQAQQRADLDVLTDDLDEMTEVLSMVEDYKERFGMDVGATVQEVFDRVSQESEFLKNRLESVKNIQKKEKEVKESEA